jgi:hypothetical protein
MNADWQIRDAIRNLLVSEHPQARVWPFLAIGHDMSDWPGLFKNASGLHGYTIFRTAAKAEWRGSGGRDRRTFDYAIWTFYGWRPGRVGDNSDDEFSDIIEADYQAFKSSPRLGLETIVQEHGLLQVSNISTINCGEETLHISTAQLSVLVCC